MKQKKNAHNLSAFKDQLCEINWPETSGLNDLSRAYEIFVENFTLIYDKCFLLRTMKARRFNLREPWFTKGLRRNIS